MDCIRCGESKVKTLSWTQTYTHFYCYACHTYFSDYAVNDAIARKKEQKLEEQKKLKLVKQKVS